MSGSPKEKLATRTDTEEETAEETAEGREVFLGGGRTLTVSEQGSDQLVEIRNASGMLELRIQLTEAGPVLQMEAVKLQLKATEAVEIESRRVEVKATETLELAGGEIKVESERDTTIEGHGDVVVKGTKIWLN
jgi:hypothetical protein